MNLSHLIKQPLTAGLCSFLIASVTTIAPAAADEAAEAFVQQVLDEAEPFLDEEDATIQYEGLEALVGKYVDMRRIGLFTLGQYARQLTDRQKAEYLPLFEEFATQIYQGALSNYSGQTLKVTGSIDRSERDIIVNSKIVDPKPGDQFADIVVHWRVYKSRSGEVSIVDAGADNIWLAIEQRSQFTSVIANNGGAPAGIDALIADLREQTSE
ncbi:MAG: hypothetical protein DHS20C05_22840 [Hyphococcus sp.]|nr:MAG: hypothetical protein DHS20C05_22840 [Marinicaulis sp.]